MSRVSFDCTMQEGQIGEELRAKLAVALREITQDVLGESPDDVPVTFSDIPKGYGFRGGEPSTTSLVRGQHRRRGHAGRARGLHAADLRSVDGNQRLHG